MELYEYLKQIRLKKGIKTRELSKNIGYSHGHISSFEHGNKTVSLKFISGYIKGVSNNEVDYETLKTKISETYKVEINNNSNSEYTNKSIKPISLTEMFEKEYELDGKNLSLEEMKMMIALVRSYRNMNGSGEWMIWGVIAIIILVLLLFGSLLEQNDLKHQLEVKEYEVKRLKDKLENGG